MDEYIRGYHSFTKERAEAHAWVKSGFVTSIIENLPIHDCLKQLRDADPMVISILGFKLGLGCLHTKIDELVDDYHQTKYTVRQLDIILKDSSLTDHEKNIRLFNHLRQAVVHEHYDQFVKTLNSITLMTNTNAIGKTFILLAEQRRYDLAQMLRQRIIDLKYQDPLILLANILERFPARDLQDILWIDQILATNQTGEVISSSFAYSYVDDNPFYIPPYTRFEKDIGLRGFFYKMLEMPGRPDDLVRRWVLLMIRNRYPYIDFLILRKTLKSKGFVDLAQMIKLTPDVVKNWDALRPKLERKDDVESLKFIFNALIKRYRVDDDYDPECTYTRIQVARRGCYNLYRIYLRTVGSSPKVASWALTWLIDHEIAFDQATAKRRAMIHQPELVELF